MKSVYGEAFRARLRQQTLNDIAGLDASAVGFGRPECCGAAPKGLPTSARLGQHVYLATAVPPTQWATRCENIPGCAAAHAAVARDFPHAGFTAFYDPALPPSSEYGSLLRLLHFSPPQEAHALSAFGEYHCPLPADPADCAMGSPWATAAPLTAQDRSFVFVCAHLQRDARCGYCGPVLADLLEQALGQPTADGGAPDSKSSVYRCAHVGGHIYAGNVLVYGRHGAVSFGLIMPDDVDTLAAFVRVDDGNIPEQLKNRVRGKAGNFA